MTSTGQPSTRETILDAAMRRFTTDGPGVRLEDIAAEAGVSRQTLYVHFGSRTGLLLGLVQQIDASGMLESLLQQVTDAPTSAEALDALAHLHAEYSPIVYPIAHLFMAARHEDEALRVAWDDRMEARRNLYREIATRLSEDGVLASEWTVDSATDVMFALTSWQLWEQLVVDQNWSQADYRERLGRVLRRVLLK